MKLIQGDSTIYFKDKTNLNISLVLTSPSYYIDKPKRSKLEGEIGVGESKDEYVSLITSVFKDIESNMNEDGTVVMILGRYHDKPIMSLIYTLEDSFKSLGFKLSAYKTYNTNEHECILVFQKNREEILIPDFESLQVYGDVGFFGEVNPSILEWAITTFSNKGELVVDPFAGKGSTLKIAHNLERKTIGVELNQKFII